MSLHITDKIKKGIEKGIDTIHSKVRTAVSKDKFRFQDGTFDLDLSYITNSVIAMGFPGTALEKAWRNSKDELADFMHTYHDNNYLIINVSERVYDALPLQRVEYFGWPDHHPPSLSLLLAIVQRMDEWLQADPLNIVAVHCMAGRGRTGTVISAYLLYTRVVHTAFEALDFFAKRRSSTGEGVQVPSQKRFVDYFASIMSAAIDTMPIVPTPRKLKLKSIIMRPVPEEFDLAGQFTPSVVVEWFTPRDPVVIYSNKHTSLKDYMPEDHAILIDTQDLAIEGDVMIRVHSEAVLDSMTVRPVFRFAFNTAFVENYILDFPKNQLDSGGAGQLKDDRMSPEFCVRLMFSQ